MEHDNSHEHNMCCNVNNTIGVQQSFNEIEFERGIWYAALYNDLDRVKVLLRKGVSAKAQDSAGYTALHYAARNGHYEVCKILLENDAEANAQTRCGQVAALHRAAVQNHPAVVELLLKHGADPDLKDADGYTALHKALTAHSISVCKLLIPRTNLSLLNSKQSIEHFTQEKCPDMLPFLLTYINKENAVV